MTHTSGFAYDTWFADMLRWEKETGTTVPLGTVAPLTPLMFEPGSRWQYGTSADWSGRLVETVSGLTLEQYFQKNILEPLGMHDTSFLVPAAKFDRLVSEYRRGNRTARSRKIRAPCRRLRRPTTAAADLYSTAPDYVRFMQMFLRRGKASNGAQILQAENRGHDGHHPDRQFERGQTEDRAASDFKRRRFSSRASRMASDSASSSTRKATKAGDRPEAWPGQASRTRTFGSIRARAWRA